MRIGIDYRMLSAGLNTVNRGMGRYTQQQLREVLKLDSQNEYVLFCRHDADASLILPEIRSAPNASVAYIDVSSEWVHSAPNKCEQTTYYTEAYQNWIDKQHVDLYHATTPFLWTDLIMHRFDVCPMVATFYDLIPLIYPDRYLPRNTEISELYTRALRFIMDSERFVAISKSARQDAINYLGFPDAQIDIAYPIADPCFEVLPTVTVQQRLRQLRQRVHIPAQFAMTVTYPHHSKNVETLLAAYGHMSPKMRRQLPLVLTYVLSGNDREHMLRLTEKYGVTEHVILTDFVTEDELVALYNAATIVIHPSRYEGFGLPVAEAMRCGAPVITTTSSSLPEVGGDAAILIDPDDSQGLADAITELLAHPAQREVMAQRGLEHAKKFNPTQLGQNTLDCYRKTLEQSRIQAVPERTRIAFWTPLPPQKSGIADYSADLLEPLSQAYDIEVFIDKGCLPTQNLLNRYTIQHYQAFERRHRQKPFDTIIYQIGSSFYHLYMYDALRKHPGITVLHDLTWSYTLYAKYAGLNQIDQFKQALAATEGRQARVEFEQIEQQAGEQYHQAVERFLNRHYMLKGIVEQSKELIVHCDLFEQELKQLYPNASISTVPLGMTDPWIGIPSQNSQLVRDQLGLASSTFVVGTFGIVDRVKRIDVCILAFAQFIQQHPDACLLIIGQQPDATYVRELQHLVSSLGLNTNISFGDYVSKDEFRGLLLACDVTVNLRYPSRKQMSGSLMQAVAAGKPVIITNLPEWNFLPQNFCWRIAPDAREIDTLAEYLLQLANDIELRANMSRSARMYFEQAGTIARVATSYQTMIERVTGRISLLPLDVSIDTTGQNAPLGFNKLRAVEDVAHHELADILKEVYRIDTTHFNMFKQNSQLSDEEWATAMTVRSLRHFGALRGDAMILGVGAGMSPILYYLTNHVQQVVALDAYLDPQAWQGAAPSFMLMAPEQAMPFAYQPNRLVAKHADADRISYPDESFDGIFCSKAIISAHDLQGIAHRAYEMGRVLKPGGVLSITAEFLIYGPPGETGWKGCTILSKDSLQRYVIDASGLELVDEADFSLSPRTRISRRNIELTRRKHIAPLGVFDHITNVLVADSAHVVNVYQGYVFCSIQMTLQKTHMYPSIDNRWAKPDSEAVTALPHALAQLAINSDALRFIPAAVKTVAPFLIPTTSTTAHTEIVMTSSSNESVERLRTLLKAWDEIRIRGWYDHNLRRLPLPLAKLGRTIFRVTTLGKTMEAEAQFNNGLVDYLAQLNNQLVHTKQDDTAHPSHETIVLMQEDTNRVKDQFTRAITLMQEDTNRVKDQFTHLEHQIILLEGQLDDKGQIEAKLEELSMRLSDHATRHEINERMAQLQAQEQILEQRQIEIDERVRQNTSYLRLMQQQAQIGEPVLAMPQHALPLMGEELIGLIQMLEHQFVQLAQANAIEFSIQDEQAEPILVEVASFLGQRMASAGFTYRMPNDAWYHVDFTSVWNRPVLFKSANARLVPGGFFVLITTSTHTEVPNSEGLHQVADTNIILDTQKKIRVLVWQSSTS